MKCKKQTYKQAVNRYLPGAPMCENMVKSQQMQKLLQIGLSALSIILFMFVFYRLGFDVMKNKADAEIWQWKTRAIEAEKIINEVNKVEKEMRKYIPNKTKRKKAAIIFVGKTRAFELPLKVAMVSAEAETCYNIYAQGPYGERGTHQAMYFTMRRYFPNCNGDLIYWEAASWLHLEECYKRSGRDLFGTVAMHNAGYGRGVSYAMRAGWKHVNRCRRIARGLSA